MTNNIINLMVGNEESFAKLYRKYAAIFGGIDLWSTLEKEEKIHAQWLKALAQSHDTHLLQVGPVSIALIKKLGEDVEEEIKSKNNTTLNQALKKALSFERSFIEKNFFELFSDNIPSARKVMQKLKKETLDHISHIEVKIGSVDG